MLISFSVKNWRSFRDRQTLNLVASAETSHHHRVSEIAQCGLRLLPTAAVYGGNASGKSNLFKAVRFAQNMVVEGPAVKNRIPVDPFRLDSVSEAEPSCFEFVFLTEDDTPYAYEFALTPERVVEEKLTRITENEDVVLFERRDGEPHIFHTTLEQEDQALHAVLGSTRDNQLFLTNAASQNTSKYQSQWFFAVFAWFTRLQCVSPNTQAFFVPQSGNSGRETNPLFQLGTGILQFDFIDEHLPQHEIKARLGDRPEESLPQPDRDAFGSRFVIDRGPDGLQMKRMVSIHQGDAGQDVRFDISDDSDGTVRLLDLFPLFQVAAQPGSRSVFLIDELDRSMHTLLVRRLLECFLDSCSPRSRSQILFTTHDVLQMDRELLRLDEMWLTERRRDGSSELIPLSSFKDIQNDPSIRTSYMRGQLGGVPKLALFTMRPTEPQE